MVVDDDRGPRESLRLILEPHFEVTAAESGDHALELLLCQFFDVVTLDLKMPGLSGLSTLGSIKEIDPDVEVIIVTGYGAPENVRAAWRLHAFDYLTKPFDAEVIVEAVWRAAAHRLRKQLAPSRVSTGRPPVRSNPRQPPHGRFGWLSSRKGIA